MKLVIFDKDGKPKLNAVLDWLIYIVGYALILLCVSSLFKTVTVDTSY